MLPFACGKDGCFAVCIPSPMYIGIVIQQRGWSVAGAAGVLILGAAQVGFNFFYLVLLPFDHSLGKAFKFFLPPYKKKQKKAVGTAAAAVLLPLVPMLGVVLAFVFVPSLSRGEAGADATLKDRVKSEVKVLRGEFADELDKGVEAVSGAVSEERIQNLKDQVGQGVGAVSEAAQKQLDKLQSDANAPSSENDN